MNQLIYDIFEQLGADMPDMKRADVQIEKEVNAILQSYQGKLTEQELETLKDMFYSVSYCSKKEAFAVGFYYAVELLLNKKL